MGLVDTATNTSTIVLTLVRFIAFLYLSHLQLLFINLFCIPFKQMIAVRMRMCTYACHTMGLKTQPNDNLPSSFIILFNSD